MVTQLTRRLIGATGILLLLLSSSADALGLHRCAHHDALPTADRAETAHHGHHAAPDGDQEKSEACTCVGTCSISTAAIAPRTNTSLTEVAPVNRFSVSPSADEPDAESAEYLLPYATAPPSL